VKIEMGACTIHCACACAGGARESPGAAAHERRGGSAMESIVCVDATG